MATYFKIHSGFIIASLCFCFNGADTQCNSSNRFGTHCDFVCHCMNNEQCNSSTGNCPSGCDFDWVGPACQHNNIVHAGSTDDNEMVVRHQSNTPVRQYAFFAVDKELSTCSHTNFANMSKEIPWWRLWLETGYKIRNIFIITNKDSLDYFKNFEVIVEKNSFDGRYGNGFTNQEVCYKHGNSQPTTTHFEVTCNKTVYGNQLRIRLASNNTQLVLCDVRIYGECPDGTFGVSCTEKCSSHCNDVCDKDYGTCSSCSSGWTGTSCNQQLCDDGKYGKSCKFNCSGNCYNSVVCRTTDGLCVDGCSLGYEGDKCDQKCRNGKYGENCVHDCSGFCKHNSACRKTDGICVGGCSPGYKGEKCDQTCVSGSYGMECKKNCSRFCFQNGSRYCSHVNGSCLHGCQAGWQGIHCNERCVDGNYGRNCTFACSGNCMNNSICNKEDGNCDHGCKAGYLGNRCKEKCKDGLYGTNCTFSCSTHCLNETICMHTNGTCMNGCEPGWTSDICKEACANGYYGQKCLQKCSTNCIGGYVNCDIVFGSCMSGCTAGWIGRKCDQECPIRLWGINCANSCGHCLSGHCQHTDGVCDKGCAAGVQNTPHCDEDCKDGSFGINCSGVCSKTCKGVCRKYDGECEYCKGGWQGANCTEECEHGRWGENCRRRCLTCYNETCNIITGACYSQCKTGFKQTEFCDEECSNGWYGLNCSEECSVGCKDIGFCRKTDGSCSECKPGLEGTKCDKQAEKIMHISVGGFAAIVVSFIVLIFVSVFVLILMAWKRLQRNQAQSENETVTYANVLVAEANLAKLNTPESSVNMEMENTYDTLKRASGIEHTYE